MMHALTPLLDPADCSDVDFPHHRTDGRRNIFVVAALYCSQESSPVRIRNMSRSGALIECAVVPPAGTQVRLSRGSRSVSGIIIWQRDDRAGVQFDSAVAVEDWMPGGRPTRQQRVDAIVESCRTREIPPADLAEPSFAAAAPGLSGLVSQLVEIKQALYAAAEALAEDPAIARAHAGALQEIDISVHKLEKLATQTATLS